MIMMTIVADDAKGQLNNNIFAHFSEHLGRCVYEGIWVGKESPIPNIIAFGMT